MKTQYLTFDDYLKEQLSDPEFRKAWDALESEYRRKKEKILKRIAHAKRKGKTYKGAKKC